MEPKVYVVKENPRLNYLDAERFGDVVFITDKDYTPMKNSICNQEIIKTIENYMSRFDPDKDFLLLTGGPVLIGYAFHLALNKKGYLQVLQWDNLQQVYIPIPFNTDWTK